MTKYMPTPASRKTVRDYRAAGFTVQQVADALDVSKDTVERHYKKELAYGKLEILNKIAQKGIIQQALKGNTTAAIFYLKTQGGWRETAETEDAAVAPIVYSAPILEGEKLADYLEKARKEAEKKKG